MVICPDKNIRRKSWSEKNLLWRTALSRGALWHANMGSGQYEVFSCSWPLAGDLRVVSGAWSGRPRQTEASQRRSTWRSRVHLWPQEGQSQNARWLKKVRVYPLLLWEYLKSVREKSFDLSLLSSTSFTSTNVKLRLRFEVHLTFTWHSPEPHLTIIWPSPDPYKTLT